MKKIYLLLAILSLASGVTLAQVQCTDKAECWPEDSAMRTMFLLSEKQEITERALAAKHGELLKLVATSSMDGVTADIRLLAALKTQQLAWLKYRAEECELIGSLTGAGGSWPSVWAAECEVKHTQSRLLQIRSAISCIEKIAGDKRVFEQNECLQQLALVPLLLAACGVQQPANNMSSAVPAGTPALDSAALISDLRTLSSPAFAGRDVGSDGNRLAQEYIKRRFAEIDLAPFGASYLTPFAFTRPARNGEAAKTYPSAANLIGHIRGSVNPERYMVVSAHYDHLGVRDGKVYPGADDNASGVAAMLAVAAHFKKHPPHNTIVFAAFDAEEGGSDGASYFINSAPIPIKQVAVNLNFDMVSRNDNNEIFAAGTSYTPALKQVVAMAAATSSVKVRLGHDSKPAGAAPDYDWTTQSDHVKFHERGIPFLYFGVEDHADYHKPGDSFEKINPVFYAEVTRLLISAAEILDRNLGTLK